MPTSPTMRYLLNSVRDEMGAVLTMKKYPIEAVKLGQALSLSRVASCLCAAAILYVHCPFPQKGF
jgi:hypothetical protein